MRRERPHPLTHRASRLLWGRSRLSHAQRVTHLAASRISESAKEPQEEKMAYIKKPPALVSRSLELERPVSELLDDYSSFIECTPGHVTNYVLKKLLSRDQSTKSGVPAGRPPCQLRQGTMRAQPGGWHDPARPELQELPGLSVRGSHRDVPLYKDAFPRGQPLLRTHVSLGAARLSGLQIHLRPFPLHDPLHRLFDSVLRAVHLCPQDSPAYSARPVACLSQPAQAHRPLVGHRRDS